MKKLLSILAAVGLTATASSAVVACSSSSKKADKGLSEIHLDKDGTATFTVSKIKVAKDTTGDALKATYKVATPKTTDGKTTYTNIDGATIVLTSDEKDTAKQFKKDSTYSVKVTFNIKNTLKDVKKDTDKVTTVLATVAPASDTDKTSVYTVVKSMDYSKTDVNDGQITRANKNGQKAVKNLNSMHLVMSIGAMSKADTDKNHVAASYQQVAETVIASSFDNSEAFFKEPSIKSAMFAGSTIDRANIKVNGKLADGNTTDLVKAHDTVKVSGNIKSYYYDVTGAQQSVLVAFSFQITFVK